MINPLVLASCIEAVHKMEQQGCLGQVRGTSYYRSSAGKCFIGQMIKDEHYNSDIEYKNLIDHIEVVKVLEESLGVTLEQEDLILLDYLQNRHDRTLVFGDLDMFLREARSRLDMPYPLTTVLHPT